MNNYTYTVRNGIYINLTNRCTNRCTFCIRNEGEGVYGSEPLWLDREPTAEDVIDSLKKYDFSKYSEVVFCGYGEPTIRIEELCEVARFVKQNTKLPIRINTNGHGNIIHGKDITPLFENIIDTVSISMNTADSKSYEKVCLPVYGDKAFSAVLDFGKCASKYVKNVIFSVVRTTIPDEDIEKCKMLAEQNGGVLRVRDLD